MLQDLPPSALKKTPSQPYASSEFTHSKRNSLLGFQGNDEDNAGRKAKVRSFLEEFQQKLDALRKNGLAMTMRDKITDNSEPLYSILDHIFSLYNINIHVISQDQSDSAIRIEPTLAQGRVVQLLLSVAVVLSRFPYSFIKLIDLNKFTVCKNAQLKKEDYEELFNNRIFTNAMFMLETHDTHEKIENFFYRVVLFHAKKKMASINTEWPTEKSPKLDPSRQKNRFFSFVPNSQKSSPMISPKKGSSPSRMSPDSKGAKPMSDELKQKEQIEIFCKIMTNPLGCFDSSNSKIQVRALFLKDKLEALDSVGVCDQWWEELNKESSIVVEEGNDFLLRLVE